MSRKPKNNNDIHRQHTAVLRIKPDGEILLSFHKREMMPMKQCIDCKQNGILALNGLFGCPRCRHYFA